MSILFIVLVVPLVLMFVISIIKVIFQYKKYGKKIFRITNKFNEKEFQIHKFIVDLRSIDTNTKIIYKNEYDCDLIVINSRGIYVISYIQENGLISGRKTDKYLSINKTTLKNPFYNLEKIKKSIEKKTGEVVTKMVVLDKDVLLSVKDDSTIITYFSQARDELEYRNNTKYNNREIEKIVKKI